MYAQRFAVVLQRAAGIVSIAVLVFSSPGCSRPGPGTVPVVGTVTFDGRPVGEGMITFLPVQTTEQSSHRPAQSPLAGDGSYALSSFSPGDGAMPGEYQVAVFARVSGPSAEDPNAPEVWAVPKRYSIPHESGLTATIPAGERGPLTIDFDLPP